MTSAGLPLVLVAAAVLAMPVRVGTDRLGALRAGGSTRRPVNRVWIAHAAMRLVVSRRATLLASIAVGAVVGLAVGLVVGGVCALLAWALGRSVATAGGARSRRIGRDALIEAVDAMIGELRAGRTSVAALRSGSAAAAANPAIRAILSDAASAEALGADAATVLSGATANGRSVAQVGASAGGGAGQGGGGAAVGAAAAAAVRSPAAALGAPGGPLRQLAGAWELSRRCGVPLADVLVCLEDELRAHRHRSEQVASSLAGARTTAGLLAVLPVVGIGLGTAMGAKPLHVLATTGLGQLVLVVGVLLDLLGLAWTAHLTRGVQS